MAEPQQFPRASLIVGRNQMLFAVPLDENGHEVVRYFTDEADRPVDVDDEGIRQALSVFGAWSDLDWDQAFDELDRIRHESRPTPPIDEI